MARKKNKKTRNGKKPRLESDPAALERKAREDYAAGRHRRAKDAFKLLHKADPQRYLPDLVDCYKAMAAEMLRKGRRSDAEPILAHLEKLTGEAVVPESLWTPPPCKGAKKHCRAPAGEIDPQLQAPRAADALVVSPIPDAGDAFGEDEARYAEDIRDALRGISERNYDHALSSLRCIPRKSHFAHWRLFVKGLCEYYRGNEETARAAFDRLPEGTAPHEAARAYVLLLDTLNGTAGAHRHGERVTRQAGEIAGYGNHAAPVARADYLWGVGRFREALRHARIAIPDFSNGPYGIAPRLRRFFACAHFDLGEPAVDKYRDVLFNPKGRPARPVAETAEVTRVLALLAEQENADEKQIEEMWSSVMRTKTTPGVSPRRRNALIHLHLGKLFSRVLPPPPFPFFARKQRPMVVDAQLAVHHLRKSIELYDQDPTTYQALLRTYEIAGGKSERNRLLDEMIGTFPDNKDILIKAGVECVNRRAFQKGASYLERAVAMDRLDTKALSFLNVARISIARKAAQDNRVKKMRRYMQLAVESGIQPSEDPSLDYSKLLARWAMLEYVCRNPKEGAELERRARSAAPSAPVLDYFLAILARIYAVPDSGLSKKHADRAFGAEIDLATCIDFVNVLLYGANLDSRKAGTDRDMPLIGRCAEHACAKGCRPAEALKFVELTLSNQVCDQLMPAARTILKRLLKADRKHPAYRLYLFKLKPLSQFCGTVNRNRELESIVEEAGKRGDTQTIAQARELLDHAGMPPSFGGSLDEFPAGLPGALLDMLGEIDEEWEDDFAGFPRRRPRKKRKKKKKRGTGRKRRGQGK